MSFVFNQDDPTRCWVCCCLLEPYGGAPSDVLNAHHVIPQAFGGTKGPTVNLCSADHDLLHLLAQKLIAKKEQEAKALILRCDQSNRQRLSYLASRVVIAYNTFNDDPNKTRILTVKLTGRLNSKLTKLSSALNVSKDKVVPFLIENAYTKFFQEN